MRKAVLQDRNVSSRLSMHKLFGIRRGPDLHAAVAKGEISDVRVLIQRGVSVDEVDQVGMQYITMHRVGCAIFNICA